MTTLELAAALIDSALKNGDVDVLVNGQPIADVEFVPAMHGDDAYFEVSG
jgi:hypothetical protein